MLILSLFPGIDLLGRGFEEEGFCVVRGPDLIFGGDVRRFTVPPGRFDGVIGGSPCQDFSKARRDDPTGNGMAMLDEFRRIVHEARPDWWLLENVPGVPDTKIDGYSWQRVDVRASEFGLAQRRLRHIQFGSRREMIITVNRDSSTEEVEPTVMATDTVTPWEKFCSLQGLPPDFDLPVFTIAGKRSAVGNGVPLPMARALARAVKSMKPMDSVAVCACGCGRPVAGKATHAGAACRKRMQRRRGV